MKTAVLANDAYVTLMYLYRWVRRLLRTLLIFWSTPCHFSRHFICSFSILLKGGSMYYPLLSIALGSVLGAWLRWF